ncbi:hypothetical protein DFH07DRAFT_1062740 [Mycena maculata]|uniref:Uncharacterized protein n=1 Tax=Mycena maculata TaxID=230809 RepID=A0AAD7IRS6_9AGAR|nr:hypothetical protein DFH07DRAFT_1062740 [Mycena maculata]
MTVPPPSVPAVLSAALSMLAPVVAALDGRGLALEDVVGAGIGLLAGSPLLELHIQGRVIAKLHAMGGGVDLWSGFLAFALTWT